MEKLSDSMKKVAYKIGETIGAIGDPALDLKDKFIEFGVVYAKGIS